MRVAVVNLLFLVLCVQCARISDDVTLTVRQTVWPGAHAVEVVVEQRQLRLTVSTQRVVSEVRRIPVTAQDVADLRAAFWRAWRHQPATRHVPQVMDGILIEQVWRGPERVWQVGTKGPLTSYEKDAVRLLNAHLPPPYQFPEKLGYE